jgi:hypothetical protein
MIRVLFDRTNGFRYDKNTAVEGLWHVRWCDYPASVADATLGSLWPLGTVRHERVNDTASGQEHWAWVARDTGNELVCYQSSKTRAAEMLLAVAKGRKP